MQNFQALRAPPPHPRALPPDPPNQPPPIANSWLRPVLDGANEVLEKMQITPENADESSHTFAAACTPFSEPTKTTSISCGFENTYEKVLEVPDYCSVQRCKFK